MNTTNDKMAIIPGHIEDANNLTVRITSRNTKTLKQMDMIDIVLHETEIMRIDSIGITDTHWKSDRYNRIR